MNKLLSQRCQPMKCAQFITTHNKVADPDLELYTQYGVPFKNKSAKKDSRWKVLGLNLGENPLLDCHFIVMQCILLSCMWHFTTLSYCHVSNVTVFFTFLYFLCCIWLLLLTLSLYLIVLGATMGWFVGMVCLPLLYKHSEYLSEHSWLPYIVLCAFAIVGGVLILCIQRVYKSCID